MANYITAECIDEVAQAVFNLFHHIGYTQNGVAKTKSITNHNIVDGVIELFITFSELENGLFANFSIQNASNQTLIARTETFNKISGIQVVSFKINVKEVTG